MRKPTAVVGPADFNEEADLMTDEELEASSDEQERTVVSNTEESSAEINHSGIERMES